MYLSYKQLLLGKLIAPEVLQVVSEPGSRVRTPRVSLGEIVGRSEGWLRPSTALVGAWVNAL